MSKNSLDHINNASSLLEIATKSFTARNHEHEIELLERAKQEIEKALKIAKIEHYLKEQEKNKDWKVGDKTGFQDMDGNDILVGNYYKNLKNQIGSIYQIRIRNKVPVVHWGGGFMKLTKDIASDLKLVEDKNVSLGPGSMLFNSKIID